MSNTAYKFTGRVVSVGKTERLGHNPSKPFLKRTLVVDDAAEGDKYPNPVPFEATGDRCAKLDGVKVEDEVEVTFRENGREWRDPSGNVRYFCSNWIVDVAVKSACEEVPEVPEAPDEAVEQFVADDLPF